MGKVNTFPSALQNISTKSLLSNLKPSSTSSAAFTVSSPFNRSPNSSQSLTTSLSTISTTSPSQSIIIKISIPNHGLQKSIRCLLSDTVWSLKKQLLEKTANEIPNAFNYGFYLPGLQGKQGKFLEEKRELFSYKFQEPTVSLEFVQKCRINSSGILPLTGEFELTPTIKKRNKAFIEDCLKGNYEKVREKCKLIDPNCWAEEEGNETPLVVAILNDDRELMNILLEHGAHLDYKLGSKEQWKSPLHIAAIHNKLKAAQLLLAAGAWSNIVDGLGLSPLYYAATYGHKDIVHRLLVARSLTDVCDENGKSPLHQACLSNHDQVAWLLIDFGANMNAKNISGNTPLHVSASRNSIDCAKYLLMRGANKEILNKANQQPIQVAAISQNNELADLITHHKNEDIVPPPPMPSMNDSGDLSQQNMSIGANSAIKAKVLAQSRLRSNVAASQLLVNDEEVEKDDSKSFYNQDSKSVMDMDIKSVIDFDMKSLIDIEVKSVIGQDTKENQDQSNLANLESYESMNRKSVKVSAQYIKSPEELINGLRLALKNNLPSESLVHALDELNELKSIVEVLNAKVQQNEVERVEMEIKMSNSIKL